MMPQAELGAGTPSVRRLGLATRGGSRLKPADVRHAVDRGINYLNWCGKPDGLSRAVAELGGERERVVVAVQFQARTLGDAEQEFAWLLEELRTGYLDVATLYYVESEAEWRDLDETLAFLEAQKAAGRLRMIGLTSHQRKLAAAWAESGRLDMLMIRYNAAHRGAERDVFPVTRRIGLPVVTFTGLRWRALLKPTPADPAGVRPPTAPECYRFCLANPDVAVALAAPNTRAELDENLRLLDDWRAPSEAELAELRAHGDRVHEHASVFW